MKIHISKADFKEDGLYLFPEKAVDAGTYTANAHMLADPDQEAFIYLAEKDGQYTYITMNKNVWPALKKGMAGSTRVFFYGGGTALELTGIYEELAYLLENIAGNANYGESFELAVAEAFGGAAR